LNAVRGAAADAGSREFLRAQGFVGFLRAGQLHDRRCEGVPNERGVYAILRDSPSPPVFMARSTAPIYRGVDPSRPIEELEARWVSGAEVLYFGRARGPGVRSLLKQRIKRLLRFGHGRVVGHWGGRFLWQLRDHGALLVAWKPTGEDDPARVEASLLAGFVARYGALPFANLEGESEEGESDEQESANQVGG
jgi:hypothetical protein